jgi:hypothetical protein
MGRTTAASWYKSAAEFQQLCEDAVRMAHGERAEEFAHEMLARARADGLLTHLTVPQLRWLCQIADHVVPLERVT